MPNSPSSHTEPLELTPLLRRFSQSVVRLGVWQTTLLFSTCASLGSLALTSLFLRFLGHQEMGSAFYISLLVPLPMTLITGAVIFSLTVALEQARSRAHALSMTDSLTGLSNRRHFLQGVQRELHLAQRHQLPMALLILDVDHFKRINDLHGHSMGDQVLIEISQCCAQALRTTDLLARWGGEEFVVLLPNTHRDHAHHLAERVREAVAGLAQLRVQSEVVRVTVSVGVACADAGQTATLDVLVQTADRALYEAKRGGRNQVAPVQPERGEAVLGVSRFAPMVPT